MGLTLTWPPGIGPTLPHLNSKYRAATGRDILNDFPYWEPAHKILMEHGIPGIENIGGELDKVMGKRRPFMAFPRRWSQGEGCVVRVIAGIDPERYRTARGS